MNVEEMIARAEKMSEEYGTDGRFKHASNRGGLYRTVFLEGGYAFKAVWNVKDAATNRAEFDFYVMTTDDVRAKLCKPLYISQNGNVIVMQKVAPGIYDDDERDAEEEALSEQTLGAHNISIGDLHGNNWGRTPEGDAVAIDYGSLEWQSREHVGRKMRASDRDCAEPKYDKSVMSEYLMDRAAGVVF